MHHHSTSLQAAIFALLLAALPAFAQGSSGPGGHSPLSQSMKTLASSFRALNRQIDDPAKKDNSLQLVEKMKDAVKKSETYEPESAEQLPAEEKAAFLADYKKQLEGVSATLDKLSEAISSGDTTTAHKLLNDINQEKRAGHGKFNSDD